MILSPTFTKSGTWITAPVSSVAGFVTLETVTLETGAVIQVPLFVNVGDKIKLDPREKRYIQRA